MADAEEHNEQAAAVSTRSSAARTSPAVRLPVSERSRRSVPPLSSRRSDAAAASSSSSAAAAAAACSLAASSSRAARPRRAVVERNEVGAETAAAAALAEENIRAERKLANALKNQMKRMKPTQCVYCRRWWPFSTLYSHIPTCLVRQAFARNPDLLLARDREDEERKGGEDLDEEKAERHEYEPDYSGIGADGWDVEDDVAMAAGGAAEFDEPSDSDEPAAAPGSRATIQHMQLFLKSALRVWIARHHVTEVGSDELLNFMNITMEGIVRGAADETAAAARRASTAAFEAGVRGQQAPVVADVRLGRNNMWKTTATLHKEFIHDLSADTTEYAMCPGLQCGKLHLFHRSPQRVTTLNCDCGQGLLKKSGNRPLLTFIHHSVIAQLRVFLQRPGFWTDCHQWMDVYPHRVLGPVVAPDFTQPYAPPKFYSDIQDAQLWHDRLFTQVYAFAKEETGKLAVTMPIGSERAGLLAETLTQARTKARPSHGKPRAARATQTSVVAMDMGSGEDKADSDSEEDAAGVAPEEAAPFRRSSRFASRSHRVADDRDEHSSTSESSESDDAEEEDSEEEELEEEQKRERSISAKRTRARCGASSLALLPCPTPLPSIAYAPSASSSSSSSPHAAAASSSSSSSSRAAPSSTLPPSAPHGRFECSECGVCTHEPKQFVRHRTECKSIGMDFTERRHPDSFTAADAGLQEVPGMEKHPLLARKGTLALQFNVDWFQPFKKQGYSMGLIYMTILNLPRAERNKVENFIFVGVLPGPKESSDEHLNQAMQPLIHELMELWKGNDYEGVDMEVCVGPGPTDIENKHIRAFLFNHVCDTPAARKVGGFASFAGISGCCYCEVRFNSRKNQKFVDCSTKNAAECKTWVRRTNFSHRYYALQFRELASGSKKLEEAHFQAHGSRYCAFMQLPYYDIVRGAALDVMHNVFLGTCKALMKGLTEGKDYSAANQDKHAGDKRKRDASENKGESREESNKDSNEVAKEAAKTLKAALKERKKQAIVSPKGLEALQNYVNALSIPSDMGRIPRKIKSNMSNFKAVEWVNFFLIAPSAFGFLMKHHRLVVPRFTEAHLELIVRVSRVCSRLSSYALTRTDIDEIHKDMVEILVQSRVVFNAAFVKPNQHMSVHLREQLLDCGPPAGWWCFPYERMNGLIGNVPFSRSHVEVSISRRTRLLLDATVHLQAQQEEATDDSFPSKAHYAFVRSILHGKERQAELSTRGVEQHTAVTAAGRQQHSYSSNTLPGRRIMQTYLHNISRDGTYSVYGNELYPGRLLSEGTHYNLETTQSVQFDLWRAGDHILHCLRYHYSHVYFQKVRLFYPFLENGQPIPVVPVPRDLIATYFRCSVDIEVFDQLLLAGTIYSSLRHANRHTRSPGCSVITALFRKEDAHECPRVGECGMCCLWFGQVLFYFRHTFSPDPKVILQDLTPAEKEETIQRQKLEHTFAYVAWLYPEEGSSIKFRASNSQLLKNDVKVDRFFPCLKRVLHAKDDPKPKKNHYGLLTHVADTQVAEVLPVQRIRSRGMLYGGVYAKAADTHKTYTHAVALPNNVHL